MIKKQIFSSIWKKYKKKIIYSGKLVLYRYDFSFIIYIQIIYLWCDFFKINFNKILYHNIKS